ncbi:diacylglycerol/lipid kinase family protein [Halopiger xanaduensis]|uniref:DAGKc domain-containing protein n=1 Tax=Halopiger xanaduensis (strain DSM 18323 / JCM 14033 / SH-6) TaxID=797210 RepID=F8DDQ4_HALXS|nr:diacylglycerol kinase family protein [Halopiger xanaduensis]AEH39156.1 Conserved hypothetical protein CHP00147 [Halopiger xanaduensis SH-6]
MTRSSGGASGATARPTDEPLEGDRIGETEIGANPERRLVLNPTSGDGDHVERVRRLAAEYGFPVVETERAGHATELAEAAAADGVDLLAACGGDGTVNEVVRGLVAADALEDVTLCVIPTGTANIYASGLGIDSVRDGFDAARRGDVRRLDLGTADGEPFVMSAIAGLPAAASVAASGGLKSRLGELAFAVEGIRTVREFDGLQASVAVRTDDGAYVWRGEALCLLIGNLRRFVGGNEPANAEDGRLEVTIVDRVSPTDAIAGAIERLVRRESSRVATIEATAVEVVALDDVPIEFSLDGEPQTHDAVEIGVRPGALRVCVGADYADRA